MSNDLNVTMAKSIQPSVMREEVVKPRKMDEVEDTSFESTLSSDDAVISRTEGTVETQPTDVVTQANESSEMSSDMLPVEPVQQQADRAEISEDYRESQPAEEMDVAAVQASIEQARQYYDSMIE